MNVIYKWIATLVALLVVFVGIYAKGCLDANQKAELADIQSQLNLANAQINKEREARVADARLAEQAAARSAELKDRVSNLREYIETLEDKNRECLSGADTQRLRNLWN